MHVCVNLFHPDIMGYIRKKGNSKEVQIKCQKRNKVKEVLPVKFFLL